MAGAESQGLIAAGPEVGGVEPLAIREEDVAGVAGGEVVFAVTL